METQEQKSPSNSFRELRKRAEDILSSREDLQTDPDLLDVKRLLTELQIHQIELEIQNEELRRTQIELIAEREKFSNLYNFAPAAYFTFNEQGIIVDLNLSAAELLGHTRKYLSNHPIAPYLTPDSLSKFTQHIRQVFKSNKPQTCELTIRPYERDEVFVNTHSVAIQSKENNLLVRSVMSDITALKQEEQRRLQSEEKYRRFLEQSSEGVALLDENGNVIEWNAALSKITGLTTADALGKSFIDIQTSLMTPEQRRPEVLEQLTRMISDALQKGKALFFENTIEAPYLRADGELHFIRQAAFPIKTQLGFQIGMLSQDVTEQKQIEAQLIKQTTWSGFISDAVITTDLDLVVTDWNSAATLIYGWTADEAIGLEIDKLLKTEFLELSQEDAQIKLAQNGVWRGQIRQKTKSGDSRFIEASVSYLRDDKGAVVGEITVNRDVSEQKIAETIQQARLRIVEFASNNSLKKLLQFALDELCLLTESPIGFFHFVEPDQRTLSLQAWSTRTLEEFCTAGGGGQHYDIDQAGVWVDCVREARPVIHNNYETLAHRKGLPDGHARVIREMVFPIIRNGRIVAIIGVGNKPIEYQQDDISHASQLADMIWDITERKRTEEKLRESEERFRTLVHSMDDVIYTLDTEQKHTGVYGDWVERAGLTPDFFLGKSSRDIFGPEAAKPHEAANQRALGGETVIYEWSTENPTGIIHYQTVVSPLKNADGEITGIVGVGREITDRKRDEEVVQKANENLKVRLKEIEDLQEKLREQALLDPLTNLYNRRYLQETLEREIARSERESTPVSLIIMDMDYFKLINDTYGHSAGDEMLRTIGQLIKENIRREDISCRYGGEEFVVVMPGASAQIAQNRAKMICSKVENLIVEYQGNEIQITASLGVATFPLHGSNGDEILIRADRALYQAKQDGRNRVSVFQDSLRTPHPWKNE